MSGSYFYRVRSSECALISKEYLAEGSRPATKRPRSFYVKSSGNQQMRLGYSPPTETRYHQINPVDSIKNAPPVFSRRSCTLITPPPIIVITCRAIGALNVKGLEVTRDPEQEAQPLVAPVAVETR